MTGMLASRPLTRQQLVERMDEYNARIAPIVRQLAMLESFRPQPTIILHANGRIELGERVPLPPDAEKMRCEYQAMIDSVRQSLFPEPDLEPTE